MPKKRKRINIGYPCGWRWKNGALRYRVPPGLEHLWEGKKEFTLGKTDAEAYRVWTQRLELHSDISKYDEAFDRYLLEVIPTKADATQTYNQASIKRLRPVFGNMQIGTIKPMHVYRYRDRANQKFSKATVNHDIEVISHLHTKLVEWGMIESNPLTGNIRKNSIPPRTRYVEDWEITEAYTVASPQIQAYLLLKLLTGLRRGDLLKLQLSDLKNDGIHIRPNKTKNSSGTKIIIQWTDELNEAVEHAKEVRKVITLYLFSTRNGQPYGKNAFDSLWSRFMTKVLAHTKVTERFQEKDLRKKTASDMELALASELLNHSKEELTKKVYQIKGRPVMPHSMKDKLK